MSDIKFNPEDSLGEIFKYSGNIEQDNTAKLLRNVLLFYFLESKSINRNNISGETIVSAKTSGQNSDVSYCLFFDPTAMSTTGKNNIQAKVEEFNSKFCPNGDGLDFDGLSSEENIRRLVKAFTIHYSKMNNQGFRERFNSPNNVKVMEKLKEILSQSGKSEVVAAMLDAVNRIVEEMCAEKVEQPLGKAEQPVEKESNDAKEPTTPEAKANGVK